MTIVVISRQEAIQISQKWYFTNEPCKRGHIAKRSTANHVCMECQRPRSTKYREENPEYFVEHRKEYYPNNKEKFAVSCIKSYAKLKEQDPIKFKEMIDRNSYNYRQKPEKQILLREYEHAWRKMFPGKVNARNAKRRAAILRAIPKWVNLDKIREIYEECSSINTEKKLKGKNKLVVDHIIPLQNEFVCGLHIESNLRIIPNPENASKYNKLLQEYTC
jgi:hypothetical protein